jgi:hypothetical protein
MRKGNLLASLTSTSQIKCAPEGLGNSDAQAGHRDQPKPELENSNNDAGAEKDSTNPAESRSTLNDARHGEGSVGYRIAAMVAMFLLAIVAIVIWYFGR